MPQENNLYKLSIIIPVYNEINFLEKFTESLTEAFGKENVEYIFVNDGSTDGSKEWLAKYTNNKDNNVFIDLDKNNGKGSAIIKGLEVARGSYILFQDSDLELDPADSLEMYELVKKHPEMKVLFGSRFLSGKLRASRYFVNEVIVRLNSIIFNILFNQSITDLHCGTKIISKEITDSIKLTIKDFGIEIDIATQIAKNNYRIYEYGVSYFSRTKIQGKKITWIDGILSYYYLFKTRFIDNESSVLISIFYSMSYMTFVGSYFGMGIGKVLMMILLAIVGCFIGLYNKLFSSSLVFLFIYFGSLFSKGNGRIYTILIAFLIGLYFSKFLSKKLKLNTNNKFINFLL